MKSFLSNLAAKVLLKLGPIASFLPGILDTLKISLEEGDADGVGKRAKELKEAGLALAAVGEKLELAAADGTLTGTEIVEGVKALEIAIDEIEDVITGVDEDDPVE